MSVRLKKHDETRWEVDLRVRLSSGQRYRERRLLTLSKSSAKRWGDDRERFLLQNGLPEKPKEVPTLGEFAPRFLDGHARANRHKPSGIVAKETIIKVHLVPHLGTKKLDAITSEHVQRLKTELRDRAPKTVNNVLTVLSTLLKKAVEWSVIDRVPCMIRLLPTPKLSVGFYDFDEYARLMETAKAVNSTAHLIVLLGGDAGLRCGEMIALEWSDVDLHKRQICVQRSAWRGHITVPKGGRLRYVPMTKRLASALREHRYLRSPWVLCDENGSSLSASRIRCHVERVARRLRMSENGVHRLRHTFCSHLAMRGAPARAIQELAGHRDLITTQRYMHLSPAAVEGAIRLLDESEIPSVRGEEKDTADR
jgi:integrase